MTAQDRYIHIGVGIAFIAFANLCWRVTLTIDDPLIEGVWGHIVGAVVVFFAAAVYFPMIMVAANSVKLKGVDEAPKMAFVYPGAVLIMGLGASLVSGLYWPLIVTTALGGIGSIGPFSVLSMARRRQR